MTSAVLVICAWVATQWIVFVIVYMDTLWLVVLLGSAVVVPAIRFYSYMVLDVLYVGIGHFLEDVRKDGSVDQLDYENVPV